MKAVCTILSIALALLLAGPAPASSAETALRLTTHNLPPYGYLENGELTGTAVRVIRCVLTRLDRPFQIDVVPWKRAQVMVKSGQAEGFFAASRNPQRDHYAVLSQTIAEQNWMWYLLKDSPHDPAAPGFREKAVVSSFLGANMQKWLRENDYNLDQSPPSDSRLLLRMLLGGRLDAALANDQVMRALIRTQEAGERVREVLNRNKPLGIYFSKIFLEANPGFLARFNAEVTDCRREDGQKLGLRAASRKQG